MGDFITWREEGGGETTRFLQWIIVGDDGREVPVSVGVMREKGGEGNDGGETVGTSTRLIRRFIYH